MTIINDILDFSKIEAGKLEVESINFNLPALMDDVARMMAHHAHSKGLELIIDVSDDVRPDVISDPSRIRQILTNLILNALKCSEVHQQGAHFWFDLKLKKTRGARTVTRAPAFGLQDFRGLIVDDNANNRKLPAHQGTCWGDTQLAREAGIGICLTKPVCQIDFYNSLVALMRGDPTEVI